MRFLLVIPLALLATACGKGVETAAEYDETFAPYVEEFNQAAADRGLSIRVTSLSIEFGAHERPVVASCREKEFGIRSIIVDPDFWSSAPEIAKRRIMLHELGHCILNRDHDDALSEHGYPKSIMASRNGGARIFSEDLEGALDELFGMGE